MNSVPAWLCNQNIFATWNVPGGMPSMIQNSLFWTKSKNWLKESLVNDADNTEIAYQTYDPLKQCKATWPWSWCKLYV